MTEKGDPVRGVAEQAVVTVPGEIDITNAEEVRRTLLAAAGRDVAVLIIDMSGTTFCDSTGVQAIIDAYNQAAATHTELRLVATAVLRILTLVGVDQLIRIYPSLEAALAAAPPSVQTGTRDLRDEPGGTAASRDPWPDLPPTQV